VFESESGRDTVVTSEGTGIREARTSTGTVEPDAGWRDPGAPSSASKRSGVALVRVAGLLLVEVISEMSGETKF
jgi:hypothetical protein